MDIEKLIELEDEVMKGDRCYCREYCGTLSENEEIRCVEVRREWLYLIMNVHVINIILLKKFAKTNRIIVTKEIKMSEYISVAQVAERWQLTTRRVQTLCNQERIKGAIKQSGVWLIPFDAKKPERMTAGKKKLKKEKKLRLLSLFSGCGGIDLGFEGDFNVLRKSVNDGNYKRWDIRNVDNYWVKLGKTRFHTVFANDIKPEAKAAWTNYFGKRGIDPQNYYLDSIVDLVKLQKENKVNIFPTDIDVLIGGFPCQDFSVSGKRMGFDSNKSHDGNKIKVDNPTVENRGQLYMWMREVIGIVKPKVFVAENVKGLTNLKDAKQIIERDFAAVCDGGYLVVPARVLNAANYGVPQGRERVIFFGFRKSELLPEALEQLSKEELSLEYTPYPQITHYLPSDAPIENLSRFVSVKDALVGLDEPENSSDLSHQKYSKAKYMGKHCQGQQEVRLDGIGPTIRAEHHGNIEFRRLSEEHGGKNEDELMDGLKERRLSVRECARIQTFPDDYEFVIGAKNGNKSVPGSQAYKIIGNAVPPLLGYHIAKRLEENWKLYFGEER